MTAPADNSVQPTVETWWKEQLLAEEPVGTMPSLADVRALLDTPDMFRAWLVGFRSSDMRIGYCALAGACPLVTYLLEHDVPNPQVNGLYVQWERGWWGGVPVHTLMGAPKWILAFTQALDKLHPASPFRHPAATVADALAVLDQIEGKVAA